MYLLRAACAGCAARAAIAIVTAALPISVSGSLAAFPTLIAFPLSAQQPPEVRSPTSVPSFSAAPRAGSVEIDGRIEEDAWNEAPAATGFVQREPVEGAPAAEDTEARVLYDDEALYVALRMYDSSPSLIADQLVRRDERGQYDFVEVAIDPALDRRTGYAFQVSAAGVQSDWYLYDDTQRDGAWDAVWESAVGRDEEGWTAELRIPLSQIRYEAADSAQMWGVNFRRERLESNEETHFALVSELQEGLVSQFGRMEGIRITEAARRLELLPYVLARSHVGPVEPGDPFFDGADASVAVGTGFRMGIGGNFTLDATVNPDFGQVEADPAVINLSAFETRFEERRPFFVEDAQLFNFRSGSSSLFYSRRIGGTPHGDGPSDADFRDLPSSTTILGAAKISGRTAGGLSIGGLVALTDEERGSAYFTDDGTSRRFLAEPAAEYGVFRIQQDLAEGASAIGGIVTGMRRHLPADGSFDRLPSEALGLGLSFELQWDDRAWALNGSLGASHVRGDSTALIGIQRSSGHYFQRPDAPYVTIDSTAKSMSGAEWRLQLDRQRGDWTGGIWAAQVTPGFEVNDLGFSTTLQRLDAGARIGYRDVQPGDHLRSWNVGLFTFHNWAHDVLETGIGSWDNWGRAHMAGAVRAQASAELLNYWEIDAGLGYGPETISRTLTRGGPVMVEPGGIEADVGFQTDRRNRVNFNPSFGFREAMRGALSRYEVGLGVEMRPSSSLEIRLEPEVSWNTDPIQYVTASDALPYAPTYGTRYIFGELERREFSMETRVNWSFSPTLTLQVFAQPLISAGDYVGYRQLAVPGSYEFDEFEEGEAVEVGGVVSCVGGRTCEDEAHLRHLDFNGDGTVDDSFEDRDFNIRSLVGNAVLRWEFRPGSRLFLVWQRQQRDQSALGDLSFGRDVSGLFGTEADDVFMLKVDYWLGL